MAIERKFGWKPSLPDQRDKKYSLHPEMLAARKFPPLVDLRPHMSPIQDQGGLSSCVAHATVGTLEYWQLLKLLDGAHGPEISVDNKFHNLSRLFIYFNSRVIDGDGSQFVDGGTHLRSAMTAIRKWGLCQESLCPYVESHVNRQPSTDSYHYGAGHKVTAGYYAINNLIIDQLKQCLVSGYPFVFGVTVYESFMSDDVKTSGMVPMPLKADRPKGGHAMCCVGYDDSKQCFIVRNSWGTSWGIQGYCYIPYDYMSNADLADDFWTLRKE